MYIIYIWRVIYRVALCMFVTIPHMYKYVTIQIHSATHCVRSCPEYTTSDRTYCIAHHICMYYVCVHIHNVLQSNFFLTSAVQGGEDPQDALSILVMFRKRAL